MAGKRVRTVFLLITTILVGFINYLTADSKTIWLNGYSKTIQGQKLFYHSPYPGQQPALLVRATDGTMVAEWETEKIPENLQTQTAILVFMGGLATGKGNHHFYLTVAEQSQLEFTTSADSSRKEWTVKNKDGLELSFKTAMVDQFDELFGYFFLKIPAKFLSPDKPLRLKLTAEKGGSPDWVMVFEQPLSSWARAKSLPALLNSRPPRQPILLEISHFGPPAEVLIKTEPKIISRKTLFTGYNQFNLEVAPVKDPRTIHLEIYRENQLVFRAAAEQKPVKPIELWLLPHSHLDIGYSDYQEEVEKKQWQNLEKALELAEKTRNLPAEARFKWNVEQLWAVETYLQQASPEKRERLFRAIKEGSLGLQATLTNTLTGLCHPEELLELTSFARKLQKQGLPVITSAMITDIPSYSWSFVPALALSGVRYLSSGPNYMPILPDGGDRVGWALKTWADRPFYWVSPSGQEKILFWMAERGYSWFHGLNLGNFKIHKKREILEYVSELEEKSYPYSMVQVRYTVGGDNGPPDPELSEEVAAWNREFITPKLVIATCQELFEEMERRHSQQIPAVRGDFSPYWEDGAASTARETAINRNLSERLLQLEVLYSLIQPENFPRKDFYQAWRQVLLFHEHTWGAHDSISNPDGENSIRQWAYKKGILDRAIQIVEALTSNFGLKSTLSDKSPQKKSVSLQLINTTSLNRSEVITIPAELSSGLDLVVDEKNQVLKTQRLSDGSLAVEIIGLEPFSVRKINLKSGQPPARIDHPARAGQDWLENEFLKLRINNETGAVQSLVFKKSGGLELVDSEKFSGLNAYLYVPGTDPTRALPARLTGISTLDSGPLVASLVLEYQAPGCHSLKTIIKINSMNTRVDFQNRLNKKKVREKESVHLAYPFRLPGAEVRLDVGWGLVNPFFEEIPGACLDFFSIQKAVSLSRPDLSLTWVSTDAPLVEIGSLTDERQVEGWPRIWKKELQPSTTLISYALNNYWHTNYKADQEGEIELRYALFINQGFEPPLVKTHSLEVNQPVVIWPEIQGGILEIEKPAFKIEPERVVVTRLKPAEDGRGLVFRIYNTSGQPEEVRLSGTLIENRKVYLSSLFEARLQEVSFPLKILPFAVVTLRVE